MGAGASISEVGDAIKGASDAELGAAVEALSDHQRSIIEEQLRELDKSGVTCDAMPTIILRSVAGDMLLKPFAGPKAIKEIADLLNESDSRPKLLLKERVLKGTEVIGEGGAGEVTELTVLWEPNALLKRDNAEKELNRVQEQFNKAGGEPPEDLRKKFQEAKEAYRKACADVQVGRWTVVMDLYMAQPDITDERFEPWENVFNKIDFDETGKLSFKNLKYCAKGKNPICTAVSEELTQLTDEDLQEMIDEADRDGDGEVDQYEFKRIVKLMEI